MSQLGSPPATPCVRRWCNQGRRREGDEQVIEKFQSYMIDDLLHVIYENKLASGHWGTGIRLYEVDAPKAVIGLN